MAATISSNVLVTGGAGYIGSHAALRLLEKGHGVTIVDNLSRGNFGAIKELMMSVARPGQLHFVEADFGDKAKMLEVCKGTRFDCVMHFAALAYVPESMAEPHLYYRNNAASTLTLLEVMREAGLKRLIFSSTWATLGEPEKMPVTEETPALPTNPYGASKKMAEDMIKDTARLSKDGFGCAILRYFNVVGSDPEGRIGEAPASEASKKYARITGACFAAATGKRDGMDIMGTDWPTPDGTCVRDYIHVTDLVNAHIAVMPFLEDNKVRLYNVGTGKGVSVREFIRAAQKVTGVNFEVREKPRREGDPVEAYGDPSKINREIGWKAQFVNVEDSLRHAWNWQVAHPNGYDNSK